MALRLRPPDTRGGAAEDERNRDDEGEEETKGRGALCEWATPIGKAMAGGREREGEDERRVGREERAASPEVAWEEGSGGVAGQWVGGVLVVVHSAGAVFRVRGVCG